MVSSETSTWFRFLSSAVEDHKGEIAVVDGIYRLIDRSICSFSKLIVLAIYSGRTVAKLGLRPSSGLNWA